jgi:hypothetical protein
MKATLLDGGRLHVECAMELHVLVFQFAKAPIVTVLSWRTASWSCASIWQHAGHFLSSPDSLDSPKSEVASVALELRVRKAPRSGL